MEKGILEAKKEIIEWVGNLEDLGVIQQLLDLKIQKNLPSQAFESPAEDAFGSDFDQQFAAGMTSEELLENVSTHIKNLSQK